MCVCVYVYVCVCVCSWSIFLAGNSCTFTRKHTHTHTHTEVCLIYRSFCCKAQHLLAFSKRWSVATILESSSTKADQIRDKIWIQVRDKPRKQASPTRLDMSTQNTSSPLQSRASKTPKKLESYCVDCSSCAQGKKLF